MSLLLLLCVGNATAKMDYPKLEKKFSNSPDKDKILNECKSYLQKMEGVLKDTAIYNTAKKKRIASLKKQLSAAKDYPTQFRLTMSLQQEYAILNLPTSLQYAIKARTLARENKVITDFYLATINEGQHYSSKEAISSRVRLCLRVSPKINSMTRHCRNTTRLYST